MAAKVTGLTDKLRSGDYVIVAEGYVFECERRCYLQAGPFVPEVVLDRPEVVKSIHEDFVHAGSDVVQAFTYYGHRTKMEVIGRPNDLERLNRQALKIARTVADDTGTLMAGNICNTTTFVPNDQASSRKVEDIFKEQIEWAVEGGADFIIAETFADYGEAALALEAIKKYGKGLPAVVTLMPTTDDITYDGVPIEAACRKLEDDGAAVVGLNCSRGPDTVLPTMHKIRETCKGPIACLPSPYRTSEDAPAMQDLRDERTGKRAFPLDLEPWLCSRSHIADFTRQLKEIGVQYVGLCCGNRPFYIRQMAEVLGREPPGSRYSANMSRHVSQIEGEEFSCGRKRWQYFYSGNGYQF